MKGASQIRRQSGIGAQSCHRNNKSLHGISCVSGSETITNGEAGMADRVAEFLQQAKMARQRVAETEGEFRGQWLRVAEMWEMLAEEYERIRNSRPENGEVP
jgi:hypothetical protein